MFSGAARSVILLRYVRYIIIAVPKSIAILSEGSSDGPIAN